MQDPQTTPGTESVQEEETNTNTEENTSTSNIFKPNTAEA